METVLSYIDTMFAGVPVTADTKRLREDITANMTDKFEELIKEGKSNNEAVGTVISEFGNIDEVLTEMGIERKGADARKPFSPVNAYVGRNLPALILRPLAAALLMIVIVYHFRTNYMGGFLYVNSFEVILLLAAAACFFVSLLLRSRAEAKRGVMSTDCVSALEKRREKNAAVSQIVCDITAAAIGLLMLGTYFLQLSNIWLLSVRLIPALVALYFVFDTAMRNDRSLTDICTGRTPERSTAVQIVQRLGLSCLAVALSYQWYMRMNLDGDVETMIFMTKFVPYIAAAYVTALCAARIIDSAIPVIMKKKEK